MRITKTKFLYCCFVCFLIFCQCTLTAQSTPQCAAYLRSVDSILSKPLSQDNQAKMKVAKKYLVDFIACENNAASPATISAQKKLRNLEYFFDATIAGAGKGGWAQRKNLSCLMVDADLQEIPSIANTFSSIQEYKNGLALATVKSGPCEGKNCFIDEKGNVIISCTYFYPESFSEGFAKAEKNNQSGFINIEGRLVIPCKYDKVGTFSEGYAMVSKAGKYGFINQYGEEVIPMQFQFSSSFKNGLARIVREGKSGYITTNGREVIPAIFDDGQDDFADSAAWVRRGSKWGFIDVRGNVIVPLDYDRANPFSEGLACVIKDGKSGYINKANTVVIPFEYEPNSVIPDFNAGLAYVIKDGKAFYINHAGEKVRDVR